MAKNGFLIIERVLKKLMIKQLYYEIFSSNIYSI